MKLTLTLAQLILACSLTERPDVQDTLYNVVLAASAGQPYIVHDLTTGEHYQSTTPSRVQAIREGLEREHHELRLGLAALSSRSLTEARLTDSRAFDVCTQIGLASLQLEGHLSAGHASLDARHQSLAKYYDPEHPESFQALDFGARVLALAPVDVSAEADAEHPRPSPTYVIEKSAFFGSGTPTTLPARSPSSDLAEGSEKPEDEGAPESEVALPLERKPEHSGEEAP